MYVSPSHPRYAELTGRSKAGPVEPSGEVLATFDRPRSGEELRITVEDFEGHEYVGLRVWAKGQGGTAFPTKRGCSIRLRELGQVIEALREAEARLLRDAAAKAGPGTRAPIGARPRPATVATSGGFDEFG